MASQKSESPSPRGVNLTGSARVLNDLVVSYHNVVQKWKSCIIDGIRAIQAIQDSRGRVETVEKNCVRLGELVELMKSHVSEMRDYQRKLSNLHLLNKDKASPCYSWTYQNIAEAVLQVTNAYEVETDFRDKLIPSLQSRTEKQLDVIAVLWLHCGQANSRIEATLEAIVRECMLKI